MTAILELKRFSISRGKVEFQLNGETFAFEAPFVHSGQPTWIAMVCGRLRTRATVQTKVERMGTFYLNKVMSGMQFFAQRDLGDITIEFKGEHENSASEAVSTLFKSELFWRDQRPEIDNLVNRLIDQYAYRTTPFGQEDPHP